jgi:outer membrane protein assembly factor BamE
MAALFLALAGCSSEKWGFPYKASVQQGNWITEEQVALLRPGMSREQVRFALGSPTLTNAFHADRWDYPYYYKPGYGKSQERKFTVWFENDKLTRWDGDKQPELQPYQLAKQNAEDSQKAAKQSEQDAARAKADAALQPAPNVSITPPSGTTGDTPGAVPSPQGAAEPTPLPAPTGATPASATAATPAATTTH